MGLAPNQMMDRQNACIPELQLEFIGTVVRPTYEILNNLFPQTSLFLTSIDENKKQWEAIRTTFTNCGKDDTEKENWFVYLTDRQDQCMKQCSILNTQSLSNSLHHKWQKQNVKKWLKQRKLYRNLWSRFYSEIMLKFTQNCEIFELGLRFSNLLAS